MYMQLNDGRADVCSHVPCSKPMLLQTSSDMVRQQAFREREVLPGWAHRSAPAYQTDLPDVSAIPRPAYASITFML